MRDLALQRFDALAAELTAALSGVDPAERARIEAEVVSLRAGLDQAIAEVLTEAQASTARLKEATGLLTEQTAKLRTLEVELFWISLKRAESGLLKLNWPAVGGELRQLLSADAARAGTAPAAPPEVLACSLRTSTRAPNCGAAWGSRAQFFAVRTGQWIKFGVWAVALLFVAFLLRWLGRPSLFAAAVPARGSRGRGRGAGRRAAF